MKHTSILQKSQQGFTLIELIIVIVILGVLAAVALPKFVDLKGDARAAAIAGVAGAISAGSGTNYAARLTGKTSTTLGGTAAVVCTGANMGAILASGLPAGYTISVGTGAPGDCTSTAVDSTTCGITDTGTPAITAVQFNVICAR